MDEVIAQVPGAQAAGRDHVLKDAESLQRKAASRLGEQAGPRDVTRVLGRFNDSVRYTISAPEAHYATAVPAAVRAMEERGLELVPGTWKNTWGSSGYPGINSTWRDLSTGQLFEVQFHTPTSFEAKTVTHDLYKQIRIPGQDPQFVAELERRQNEIFDAVPRPPGAPGLAP